MPSYYHLNVSRNLWIYCSARNKCYHLSNPPQFNYIQEINTEMFISIFPFFYYLWIFPSFKIDKNNYKYISVKFSLKSIIILSTVNRYLSIILRKFSRFIRWQLIADCQIISSKPYRYDFFFSSSTMKHISNDKI